MSFIRRHVVSHHLVDQFDVAVAEFRESSNFKALDALRQVYAERGYITSIPGAILELRPSEKALKVQCVYVACQGDYFTVLVRADGGDLKKWSFHLADPKALDKLDVLIRRVCPLRK